MTGAQGRVTTYAVFVKPQDFSTEWEKSDLWTNAASIPGVQVMQDDGGVEAQRFRSLTSGQTVLYDKNGKLLFSGGMTAARGHEGDNAGRSAIVSILNEGKSELVNTPVFGCALFAEECPTRIKEGHDEGKK
jgi:hypothetical protein